MKTRKNYKLELYHDTLARRIFDRASQEDKMRLQIERLVRDKYNFFQSGKGGLLSKDELSLINSYRSNLHLKEEYLPYIKQSQQVVEKEEKKEVRRLRNLLFVALGVLIIVALLGLWALRQRALAKKSAAEAIANQELAEENERKEKLARLQADSLNIEINSTNDQLVATSSAYYRAKTEAELNAIKAEGNAADARRAERLAQRQKEQAIKKSIAYRLLVTAVEQRNKGAFETAFRVAERANGIFKDSAILDFMRQTYNALPEQEKLVTSFDLGKRIQEAKVSPDGNSILLSQRSALTIWYPKTNKTIDIPINDFKHAGFSPDGSQIITVANKTATIWNAQDGKSSHTYIGTKELLRAFILPGNKIVTVGEDHVAHLWLSGGEQPIASFMHRKEIKWVAATSDGQKIATASYDKMVKLWDVEGTFLDSLEHPFWLEKAIFPPSGQHLLAQDINNELWLWSLKKKQEPKRFKHKAPINSYAFSKDGQSVLSAANDETARLWSLSGQLLNTFPHSTNDPNESVFIKEAVFSPNENYILTGTALNQLFFWDRKAANILADYSAADEIKALGFIDQDQFMTATQNGKVTVWKTYPSQVAAFSKVDLPELGQMGYEMPIAYWVESDDPAQFKGYLDYFLAQVDNFKRPDEQIVVLEKAARIAEKWMAIQDVATLADKDREDISNIYGNLSWYRLLEEDYSKAEKAALRCLGIYPEKAWAKTNLALAYLLTGRYAKARPLYVALATKPFDRDENEERLFKYFFLDDLKKLNDVGVDHPDFEQVRDLLKNIGEE